MKSATCSFTYGSGATLRINYDPDAFGQNILYTAKVPNGSYLSVGYGTSMFNTDMILWSANGASSKQQDMYSTGHYNPSYSSKRNAYTTKFTYDDTFTFFESSRPLAKTSPGTYVIPVGQEFNMIFAFYQNHNMVYHNKNIGNFAITLAPTGGCISEGGSNLIIRSNSPLIHGGFMWVSWSLISALQVWTNRYLVHYWKWRQTAHTVLGVMSGIFTITALLVILHYVGYKLHFDTVHTGSGIITVVLCLMLILGGIFGLLNRRFVNNDWKTKSMLRVLSVHRYFGYFMIFAVQLSVLSGILYLMDDQNQHKVEALFFANVGFVIVAYLFAEIWH